MLQRKDNTILCPDCGRSWHFMEGLKDGDACPSDGCPSNEKTTLGVVNAVCEDFDGNGIYSVGAIGALRAMSHHWKNHLTESHNPKIISEDIDEMKNQLEVMRAEIMRRLIGSPCVAIASADASLLTPAVSAEAHSDDRVYSAKFDAAPWFAQASVEEITNLYDIKWRGDYAADAVAHFFDDKNQDVSDLFKYIGKTQGTSRACGFECSVEGDEAMAWLKRHRRDVWAVLLCHDKDVRLIEAQEEEIRGMWDWLDDQGNACAYSFPTIEDAALNAVEVLGLSS